VNAAQQQIGWTAFMHCVYALQHQPGFWDIILAVLHPAWIYTQANSMQQGDMESEGKVGNQLPKRNAVKADPFLFLWEGPPVPP
jgi:hypothetical protein